MYKPFRDDPDFRRSFIPHYGHQEYHVVERGNHKAIEDELDEIYKRLVRIETKLCAYFEGKEKKDVS